MEALQLYKKQKWHIEVAGVKLRVWQQDLMKTMQQDGGNHRKVYWINGSKANEGKSCMQFYVEPYYGYSRVIFSEIRNKTSNILHAITKRPLQTTDIFIFNDTHASDMDVEQIMLYWNLLKMAMQSADNTIARY